MNRDYRIMFLRDRKGQPVGCISIVLEPNDSGDWLAIYQVSVRNPTDRFNRSVARQLALGRMVEAPYTVKVPHNPKMFEVTHAIMNDIAKDTGATNRARQAAKLWLTS